MIFHENCLLADNSHVISYLIFLKIRKILPNLSSAAVMIGALRVKEYFYCLYSICVLNSALAKNHGSQIIVN